VNTAKLPFAIPVAFKMQHNVDRRPDLRGKHLWMRLSKGDCGHRRQPYQGIGGRIRMHCPHRTAVASVERSEQFDDLVASDFANNQAIGPHAKRIA